MTFTEIVKAGCAEGTTRNVGHCRETSSWPGVSECDQIYTMWLDGSDLQRISTGEGRTTCGYFVRDGSQALFSSTHHVDPACPVPPDRSQGYVWGLFAFDVFVRDLATGELRRLTDSPGYDAEATLSPDGTTMVFTSDRSGDLNLWAMSVDGSNKRQVTDDGASNFAPFFHPDGRRIVFSSNLHQPGGRSFHLYLVGDGGTGLERVTGGDGFNSFPMFSPDGRHLVFASDRGAGAPGEINVFLATWNEEDPSL